MCVSGMLLSVGGPFSGSQLYLMCLKLSLNSQRERVTEMCSRSRSRINSAVIAEVVVVEEVEDEVIVVVEILVYVVEVVVIEVVVVVEVVEAEV